MIDLKQQIKELEEELNKHNIAYAAGIPFITDSEYDVIWKQLYDIDPDNPILYHTAQDRTALTGLSWHKQQIFGTNKAFNMDDLKPFLTRFGDQELTIEPKYDGCAAIITITKKGITLTLEGDGKCGKDISYMLPYIKMPFQIRNFQSVELIIPVEEWKEEYGANPRNVVAGWLARKYDAPDAMITAIPHDFGTYRRIFRYSGDVEAMSEELLMLYADWSKVFPMDGLMIKVADEKTRLIAGNNGVTNSWSIAWKPPIQVKETVVKEIEWNVSRLGRVIPTVSYEPIKLCNTTNTRVTANNAQWIHEKGIYNGATISVGKAGEIIPKIISVKNPKNITLPTYCPTCCEPLDWEGVHLICNGDNCIAKKIVSIAYFYSKKGIKIDGVGERLIEKLLTNRKCYEVLAEKPWALLDCATYDILDEVIAILGVSIAKNILQQTIDANKKFNMAHFISGLGLPSVAYKTALRLCQYLKTGVLSIHIHQKARQSFSQGALIFSEASKEMKNFAFASLPSPAKAIYCITGALSQPRDAMIAWLADQGYEFSSGVTRETNYLVVGESPGKTKIAKAEKYDIPQITEAQLITLLEGE